ncbi:prepilin peptidase [Paraburkholderia sp. SARCC-3016]|uniref:A24 family peptidase n=1 Tax=Paraburkholderia sp. SARCC-3016 TaxID=3058611 RepID=UPI002809993A|nr:prepilin peptidase [Paraburkholderia sp. SARCC-3016]MDQ7981725.1 prepilin peptidase [Paraburkholderia sp. SARCC-3016]
MWILSAIVRLVAILILFRVAVIDVRYRRLPTGMIGFLGALFFIEALIIGMPIRDLLSHLLIAIFAIVVGAILFALGLVGGGDAKLASVIFLWVGLSVALPALTLICVAGLGISLISIATRHIIPEHRSRLMRTLAMFSVARGVPYGVALALGGVPLIVMPLYSVR